MTTATESQTRCRCGAQTENPVQPDGFTDARSKCPVCHTFSTDHSFMDPGLDSYGEYIGRCGICDIREHSHR